MVTIVMKTSSDTDISLAINSAIYAYSRVTEDPVRHPQLKFQRKSGQCRPANVHISFFVHFVAVYVRLLCGLSLTISFIKENDVVRCVVYRDNNVFVMEVKQMSATFGSLHIYVAGVPIGLFIF